MAGPYYRFADPRLQPQPSIAPPTDAIKRPRLDMPAGPEMAGYYSRDGERSARPINDSTVIGASFDRYLRGGVPSYGTGELVRTVGGGVSGHAMGGGVSGHAMGGGVSGHAMGVTGVDSRSAGYSSRLEPSLPPDATNTLFVEGLPANCTRREVSHIFRPFVGFQEVRLVNKESRIPGGDPLVLCFVDFSTPAQSTVALEALQGYRFDEHDRESANLRLQFARFPGPRSASGSRGKR